MGNKCIPPAIKVVYYYDEKCFLAVESLKDYEKLTITFTVDEHNVA